jgi:prepilin peptidase CpaA
MRYPKQGILNSALQSPPAMLSFTFPPPAIAVLLLVLVFAAAAYDVAFRRIPNWLAAAGVLLGLATNTFLYRGWPGLRFSLAGLVAAFAVYFALHSLRAIGGGDVKLMAAVGSLAGWHNWIGIFLITAIVGGIAAVIVVTRRRRVGKTLRNVGFILSEMKSGRAAYAKNEELDVRSSKALRLPHGAVIAAGTAVFLALVTQ